jgi:hypothetical protein
MIDKKTLDICEMDLAGPVPVKPTAKERAAARAIRFRERYGVRSLTVQLPIDIYERFDECVKKRAMDNGGMSKSDYIVKLIESQLLRKR